MEMGGTSDFKGLITHGPWGGSDGDKWVYILQSPIEKIIVRYGTVLDSIEFQTNCSKGEPQSSLFGDKISRPNSKVTTISLDSPNEYLMSISGTVGSVSAYLNLYRLVVKSICFKTNLNLYGPYGIDKGTAFSYEVKDEVIVGFHGRSESYYLNAIGVYAIHKSPASPPTSTYEGKIKNELCCSKSIMTLPRDAGPWGACGGQPWDDGVFSTIKQVCVHLGELNVIYGLQFEYLKSDGKSVLSQIHGGTNGVEIHLVNLDDNGEFLTGISGFCGPVKGFHGLEAVLSIKFHTNLRIHGPYGEERSAGYVSYSSPASFGKVVGFHGKNNGFLSAMVFIWSTSDLKAAWTFFLIPL
ncbi:putative jacalin-like lectin domain-containing protein [Helianthus annuus]|nr:putative jacalin-like lectin domain-containing protein [Helianthus annuus]KAJ0776778.1 putative jacalin-like lectin domain-containing protein [Helianthus annuus]KAJ0951247.1 putative jacalin-like lectin domain-containing protein [Helianthus annuus]